MSVVLRPPDALPRPPAASAAGAVGAVRVLTPSATTIRCGKCGGARPVGHAHCFTCGAKLTGRAVKSGRRLLTPSWSAVRAWDGWRVLRRIVPGRESAAVAGHPVVELRSFGDRVARWYTSLSAVGAIAWFVWGGSLPISAAGGLVTPSEACAWIDSQRAQLTGEAARVVDAQRGGVAQRLGELAAVVGSGASAR